MYLLRAPSEDHGEIRDNVKLKNKWHMPWVSMRIVESRCVRHDSNCEERRLHHERRTYTNFFSNRFFARERYCLSESYQTPVSISNRLVEISKNDVDNHNGKASLVVMGTRELDNDKDKRTPRTKAKFVSTALGMGVTIVYRLLKLGFGAVMPCICQYSFVKLLAAAKEGRLDEKTLFWVEAATCSSPTRGTPKRAFPVHRS